MIDVEIGSLYKTVLPFECLVTSEGRWKWVSTGSILILLEIKELEWDACISVVFLYDNKKLSRVFPNNSFITHTCKVEGI